MPTTFSDDFVFGASTSSYQIEGAFDADGRGPSIWDTFSHIAGNTADGATGDVACDHYHRVREDVALMGDLGLDVYRFSVAWPRVFPDGGGSLNKRGLDFYDRLLDELLTRDIEPWPCLYHWDLPQALQDRGGWANRDLVGWYLDYAAAVVQRLGDRARRWALFNEPSIVAVMGYLNGGHAPGIRNMNECLAATHHLNLATGTAARALRDLRSGLEIGTILALNWVQPATDDAADRAAAATLEAFLNGAYLDPLYHGRYPEEIEERFSGIVCDGDLDQCRQPLDFLGVNHYSRLRAEARDGAAVFGAGVAGAPEGAQRTAMGWEVYPDGLWLQLQTLKERYGNPPVYVTENGAAFADEATADGKIHDRERIDYLRAYLVACARAIDEGVDLRGYLVWSLLDNFEWAEGYTKRFGLVRVDYETLDRMPKDSFHWYAEVVRTHRIPEGV